MTTGILMIKNNKFMDEVWDCSKITKLDIFDSDFGPEHAYLFNAYLNIDTISLTNSSFHIATGAMRKNVKELIFVDCYIDYKIYRNLISVKTIHLINTIIYNDLPAHDTGKWRNLQEVYFHGENIVAEKIGSHINQRDPRLTRENGLVTNFN